MFKHCFKNCETNPNNAAGVFFPSDLQLFPGQIVVIVKSALSSAPKLCLIIKILHVSLLAMVSTIFYMTITNCDDMTMVVVVMIKNLELMLTVSSSSSLVAP